MTAERAACGTPIARAVPKGRAGSCPAGRKARSPWVRRHRSGTHYLSDWAVPPVVHLLRSALPLAENSVITASAGRQTKPSWLTICVKWRGVDAHTLDRESRAAAPPVSADAAVSVSHGVSWRVAPAGRFGSWRGQGGRRPRVRAVRQPGGERGAAAGTGTVYGHRALKFLSARLIWRLQRRVRCGANCCQHVGAAGRMSRGCAGGLHRQGADALGWARERSMVSSPGGHVGAACEGGVAREWTTWRWCGEVLDYGHCPSRHVRWRPHSFTSEASGRGLFKLRRASKP